MTIFSIIFYVLAFVLLVSTALAITRTRLVHAVIYLVVSFFTTALLFYLLGAPFLAALEVIIYAGAIMVMFLFMIMTLRLEEERDKGEQGTFFRSWIWPVVLGLFSLVLLAVLIWAGPDHGIPLGPAMVSPREFGAYIFREFWFPVEIASLLLFVALVGALYLGRAKRRVKKQDSAGEVS